MRVSKNKRGLQIIGQSKTGNNTVNNSVSQNRDSTYRDFSRVDNSFNITDIPEDNLPNLVYY